MDGVRESACCLARRDGGKKPELAYRRFAESGQETPPANPRDDALEGWLLGSDGFLQKIKKPLNSPNHLDETPKVRRLTSLDSKQVNASVAVYFNVSPSSYQSKCSAVAGRDLAAYLAHRHTTATLRELATAFGLTHPDSVSNLIRRAQTAISTSKTQKLVLERIEEEFQKQKTGSAPRRTPVQWLQYIRLTTSAISRSLHRQSVSLSLPQAAKQFLVGILCTGYIFVECETLATSEW